MAVLAQTSVLGFMVLGQTQEGLQRRAVRVYDGAAEVRRPILMWDGAGWVRRPLLVEVT